MASQGSFDDLLQCSICLERFTQPKALPCLHTFCLSCLRGIVKDAKTVDCPTCRSAHQVPKEGVVGFKDNLMAMNFLSMIGESTECNDCGKKQILSGCEHCQQQVCADCRAAHNRLAGEITILIQALELGFLKNPDDKLVQAAQSSLNKTEKVKTDIHAAFDEAMVVLKERKYEMIQQVEMVSKIQRCVTKGTSEATIEEIRQELSSCGSKEGLKRMKESLMRVEEMLSEELEFSYDVSGVARFGELRCGGETVTKETTIKPGSLAVKGENVKPRLERKLAAGGDSVGAAGGGPRLLAEGGFGAPAVIPARMYNSGLAASGLQAADRFPAHVDYQEKNRAWKRVFSNPPPDCYEFRPTAAIYSVQENSIYCLSSGELIKFDIDSGVGKIICSLNVAHFALTDSGTLLLVTDETLMKASSSALANPETDYANSLQIMTLNCTKAVQVCSHRNEVVILDSGKKCLLKLDELGKLVKEIKLSPGVNKSSRMCVDREGRIYVSGVRVTGRKDNAGDWYCPQSCRLSPSVKVSWKVVISILTWDGEESGQLLMDGESKDYDYKFNKPAYTCPAGVLHMKGRRDDNSAPDDLVIREHAIGGLCVDGDGYISVTRPGKNQIDVYDPKHKLFCTIGNKVTPELKEPRGLTLMPDGRLVVCDTGNNRIKII